MLLGVIAALVVLGAVAGCGSEPEPIKIGVIPGLEEETESTQNAIKGMRLSVEEINKRGGVNGRKIELIIAEYETADKEHVLQALENIEQAHKPLAFISFNEGVAELVAAFAEEHEVVHVAILTPEDATRGREWAFQYAIPVQNYFGVAVGVVNKLGVESLSFLYNRDAVFGPLFATITPQMLGRPALEIERQSFGDQDTDFREQIKAIMDSDAISFYTPSAEQARDIVRQLRELDYTGHILTQTILVNPNNPNLPEFIGVYVSTTIIHRPDFLFAQGVRERFDAVYDTTDFSFFNDLAAGGYDTVRLIAELLELVDESAGRQPAETDGEQARENLRNMLDQGFSYDGIFGNITLLPGQRTIDIPIYPAQYGARQLEYLR